MEGGGAPDLDAVTGLGHLPVHGDLRLVGDVAGLHAGGVDHHPDLVALPRRVDRGDVGLAVGSDGGEVRPAGQAGGFGFDLVEVGHAVMVAQPSGLLTAVGSDNAGARAGSAGTVGRCDRFPAPSGGPPPTRRAGWCARSTTWRRRRAPSCWPPAGRRPTRRSRPTPCSPSPRRTCAGWAATCSPWSTTPTAPRPTCSTPPGRAGSGADADRLRAEGHTDMPFTGDVRSATGAGLRRRLGARCTSATAACPLGRGPGPGPPAGRRTGSRPRRCSSFMLHTLDGLEGCDELALHPPRRRRAAPAPGRRPPARGDRRRRPRRRSTAASSARPCWRWAPASSPPTTWPPSRPLGRAARRSGCGATTSGPCRRRRRAT